MSCRDVASPQLTGSLIGDICLVASEAVTNAVLHGVRHEGEPLSVTIEFHDDRIELRVTDHGPGFDLDAVDQPDLDHPAECGYGIFIMRSLMDEVSYRQGKGDNELLMIKLL